MAFVNQRFFEDIRAEMTAGPEYRTIIKQLRGGAESRNALWANPLRSFTLSLGARDADRMSELLDFAADTEGAANAFRLKDWTDFKSCRPLETVDAADQQIGTGDGVTYYFRLVKSYGTSHSRRIMKPVFGTTVVELDGVPMTATQGFIDTTNGVVVFKNPPINGAVVTAGFEFDVPVRFSTDITEIATLYYRSGMASNISMQEVRMREVIDTAVYDIQRAAL